MGVVYIITDNTTITTIVAIDLADREGKNSGSHVIYICHIIDKKLNNRKTSENIFKIDHQCYFKF